MMTKRILSLFLALTLLLLCSCSRAPKYSHAELAINLPGDFYSIKTKDFDAAFTDGVLAVAVLRITFSVGIVDGIPETLDDGEFGRLWLKRCGRAVSVQYDNGHAYCEYYETVEGKEYFYLDAFYRSMNAYFVVLFAVTADNSAAYKDIMNSYAKEVYFLDN